MTNNVTEASVMIMAMSNDELNEIVETIRFRRNVLSSQARRVFRTGDRVQFYAAKYGQIFHGRVIKIMRKNIRVKTDDHMTWTVAANLLEFEKETEEENV